MFNDFISFVRELYQTSNPIPLHEPTFVGNEKKYLLDAIDSTYVSSVGESIGEFENKIANFTGIKFAVATSNGTSALHLSLLSAGVEFNTEVLTQSLTFVATCNAITYCGAKPIFLDVGKETLTMVPSKIEEFINENCEMRDDGFCWNSTTGKKISACMPMHTYGFPAEIGLIKGICNKYNIPLVEDCAESLGSFYGSRHSGSEAKVCALSFNGNKIITTGGGGMILTNDEFLANKARHLSTVAKVPHSWEFNHDAIGFNYRMPNLNAALGLAQIELLKNFLISKRLIAEKYQNWGKENGYSFLAEQKNTKANYWLNCLITESLEQRDKFLLETNMHHIMTAPSWNPIHTLPDYKDCQRGNLDNTIWLFDRLVNVPSSPIS